MSPALTLPLPRHPPRLGVLSPTSPALGRAARARCRRARPHRTQTPLPQAHLRAGGGRRRPGQQPSTQERRGEGSRTSASGTAAAPPQRNLWAQNGEDEKKRLRRGPAGSQASAPHQTPTPEDALPGAPGRRAARPARPALGVGSRRYRGSNSSGPGTPPPPTALTCSWRPREAEGWGRRLTPKHLAQLTSAAPPSPLTERAPRRESRLVLPHRPPIPTQEGTPAH